MSSECMFGQKQKAELLDGVNKNLFIFKDDNFFAFIKIFFRNINILCVYYLFIIFFIF